MNHIYRLIWKSNRTSPQVASELEEWTIPGAALTRLIFDGPQC